MPEQQSDETKIAVLQVEVRTLNATVQRIEETVGKIDDKLDNHYATKEEVGDLRDEQRYWRNILVTGILLTIALALILKALN